MSRWSDTHSQSIRNKIILVPRPPTQFKHSCRFEIDRHERLSFYSDISYLLIQRPRFGPMIALEPLCKTYVFLQRMYYQRFTIDFLQSFPIVLICRLMVCFKLWSFLWSRSPETRRSEIWAMDPLGHTIALYQLIDKGTSRENLPSRLC